MGAFDTQTQAIEVSRHPRLRVAHGNPPLSGSSDGKRRLVYRPMSAHDH
jgi:hypothetical protein